MDCFQLPRARRRTSPGDAHHPRTPRARSGRASAAVQRDLEADRLGDRRRRTRDHPAADGARPGLPSSAVEMPWRRWTPWREPTHLTSRAARSVPTPRYFRTPRSRPAARAGRAGRRAERSHRASRGRASRCTTTACHGLSSNWWVSVEGVQKYRLDLAYPHARVAIEYDGEEFHTSPGGQAGRRRSSGLARATRLGGDRGRQGLVHRRGDRRCGSRRSGRALADAHRPPAAMVRAVLSRNSRVPGTQLARTGTQLARTRDATQRITGGATQRGSGEGGAHRGEGGGEAGEQLELERRLVDEQVQAGDQHLAGRRPARAPTRERGRPRVVDAPRRPPGRRAQRATSVVGLGGGRDGGDHDVADDRRRRASEPTSTRGPRRVPARARPRVSAARRGVADQQRDVPAPRSARARPVEAAVAPPPRTVAGGRPGPSYRSRTAADGARDVGVVGRTDRPSSSTSVLAAPASRATGRCTSSASAQPPPA